MSWRQRAIETIDKALEIEDVKASTIDRHRFKAAISRFYPFGQRKNHPYRQWLKVVNEYADRICVRMDYDTKWEVVLRRGVSSVNGIEFVEFAIRIHCDFCKDTSGQCNGCLVCATYVDWLAAWHHDITGFINQFRRTGDITTLLVFADWCDDHDNPELAEKLRKFVDERYGTQKTSQTTSSRLHGGRHSR